MAEMMVLDADLKAMAEVIAARPPLDLANVDIPALRAAINAAAWPTQRTEVASVADLAIATRSGTMAARLYRPRDEPGLPLLVFYHGGGFVLCSLDTHDNFCRALAAAGDCALLSIDYRLAPEHAFPAAFEDACDGLDWAAANAARLGCDPERLAVAGDSAGGNLALAAALHASPMARAALRHVLLYYPALDPSASAASYDRFCATPFLSSTMMRWYWRNYAGDRPDLDDIRLNPARSTELSMLPSATVAVAEYDPLRDEVEQLGRQLAAAGVDVESRLYTGVSHGFASMVGLIGKARPAIDHGGDRLRAAFSKVAVPA